MTKKVILTGIRANNDLHIGNYFGAMLPLIDMAKKHAGEYQVNLFVPDLHSFTTPIDHSQLQANIQQATRLFVAAGLPLNNDNVHIYRQSYVPAHSELTLILNCFTGFGEMSRMTQFKDKSGLHKIEREINQVSRDFMKNNQDVLGINNMMVGESKVIDNEISHKLLNRKGTMEVFVKLLTLSQQKESYTDRVSVGLFDYPVLMAADILLYGATYVPVGDDQSQHLEFTRDIAKRMNKQFGELFVIPKPVKQQHEFFGNDQGLRIKDLSDPTKKMSKSDDTGKGIIFLGDEPEAAAKKIMSATTDNEGVIRLDREKQPGIANLLQILALLEGDSLEAVAKRYEGKTSYGELKQDVATKVKEFLVDFQTRLANVDEEGLRQKLETSEAAMNQTANQTLAKVQKVVGLR